MAMHPQEWSIHALSVEFGINPNVVSRRLRDVQPCRSEGNLRWWRMSEAAPALSNPTRAGGDQSREDADRRRAIAEAEIAEAKAGQIKGDLVPSLASRPSWSGPSRLSGPVSSRSGSVALSGTP